MTSIRLAAWRSKELWHGSSYDCCHHGVTVYSNYSTYSSLLYNCPIWSSWSPRLLSYCINQFIYIYIHKPHLTPKSRWGVIYPEWIHNWDDFEASLSADIRAVSPLLTAAGLVTMARSIDSIQGPFVDVRPEAVPNWPQNVEAPGLPPLRCLERTTSLTRKELRGRKLGTRQDSFVHLFTDSSSEEESLEARHCACGHHDHREDETLSARHGFPSSRSYAIPCATVPNPCFSYVFCIHTARPRTEFNAGCGRWDAAMLKQHASSLSGIYWNHQNPNKMSTKIC